MIILLTSSSESRENEYEKASGGYSGSTGIAGSQAGKSATQRATDDSALPGPAPHTAGPHRYDWLNKLDPRVNANPDMTTSPTTEGKSGTAVSGQHYARDAALGAGVGGVGGATYGSAKQGHGKKDSGIAGILPTTMDDQKYDTQYTTDQNTSGSRSTRDYQGPRSGDGSQTVSAGDKSYSSNQYGRDAVAAGGGPPALGGAAALGEHGYQKHEQSIPLTEKGATREADDKLQGAMGPTRATGPASATGTSGTATKGGVSSSDYNGSGTSTLQDRSTGQHHYGRDAVGAGGTGGVGIAAHELYKHEGLDSSGAGRTQTTGQQPATAISSSDNYGTSIGAAKERAGQQQYGSDPAATSGIGSTEGTSKQQYRSLSSGTPSGIDSSQYGASTSDPRSIMPGTFPETSTGLDTYDSPMTSTQGGGAAGVGTQGYTTAKHGPTAVTSGERGSNKLHKEPPLEHLASTVKRKLAS